ncbi:MAG: hypothetical protein AAGK04_07580 [Planctomycetota bacterium]
MTADGTPPRGPERRVRLDIVEGDAPPTGPPLNNFIGVWFSCSNRYVRVLRDDRRQAYTARCPQCGQTKRFRVAANGERRRLFELSCTPDRGV